jgi:hypothetical protein
VTEHFQVGLVGELHLSRATTMLSGVASEGAALSGRG